MMTSLTRRIRPALRVIARQRFESAKDSFIKAVAAHPVCKDMSSHRPSPLLGGSSTGTLFGFLGMEEGSDPVGDLLNFFEDNITFQERAASRGLFSAIVTFPSKSQMSEEGSLCPYWIDVAWPVLVEDGVSGLPLYINKYSPNSVSGEGIQGKTQIRGDFQGVEFLRPLVGQFRQQLLLK